MAKKASPQDDTGSAPAVPFEAATTDAAGTLNVPLPAPEADPVDRVDPIEVVPVPARKIVAGRLNRVTLAEARAMRKS